MATACNRYANTESQLPSDSNASLQRGAGMGLIPSRLPASKKCFTPPPLSGYAPEQQGFIESSPTVPYGSGAPISAPIGAHLQSYYPPQQQQSYPSQPSYAELSPAELSRFHQPHQFGQEDVSQFKAYGEGFDPATAPNLIRDPRDEKHHLTRRFCAIKSTSLQELATRNSLSHGSGFKLEVGPVAYTSKRFPGDLGRVHVINRRLVSVTNPFNRAISVRFSDKKGSLFCSTGHRAAAVIPPNKTVRFSSYDENSHEKIKQSFQDSDIIQLYGKIKKRDDLFFGKMTIPERPNTTLLPIKTSEQGENLIVRLLANNHAELRYPSLENEPKIFGNYYLFHDTIINHAADLIDARILRERCYRSRNDFGIIIDNPEKNTFAFDDLSYLEARTGMLEIAKREVTQIGTLIVEYVETIVIEDATPQFNTK